MTRFPLPAPCHLCGQTCLSSRRGRVTRRLDRADLGRPAERTDADTCPWRQCPHRPSGFVPEPVLEDQQSFGVVASTWPPGDRPPVVLSLHPARAAAETDRDLLAAASPIPRPRGVARTDYDVVEFPHALIAAQLDAAQEEGYRWGYEHAMESACERLREDGRLPAATATLRRLAGRDPGLFAATIGTLFAVEDDIAAAVAESVRLGYPLDAPLDAALNAAADPASTGGAP
ncbi:MAG: hypothetical protein OXH75_25545 [Acidobacteria bacterium]|nr:hypothetical protein [Acidobacteriota bacterium]